MLSRWARMPARKRFTSAIRSSRVRVETSSSIGLARLKKLGGHCRGPGDYHKNRTSRMMIGIGIPISQRSIPFPKPMVRLPLCFMNNAGRPTKVAPLKRGNGAGRPQLTRAVEDG